MKKTTIIFGLLLITSTLCIFVYLLLLFDRSKRSLNTLPCDDCKLYYNQKEKIAFYYPSSWVAEDLKPYDILEPFVRLSDQGTSTLYFGGPNVFSTSGAICIDPGRFCGEPEIYDLIIMDRSYQLTLFGLYPVNPEQRTIKTRQVADFYRFQLEFEIPEREGWNKLVVTGQISDAIALESITPIISSIQIR